MPPKKITLAKKPVIVEQTETKPMEPQKKETKPKASKKLPPIESKKAGRSKSKEEEKKIKPQKSDAKSKDLKEEVKVNPAHKPRKALTSYTIFNTEFCKEMRAAGQTQDLFKLASEKWGSMSENEKAPYEKKNELEKERNIRQTEEL